MKYYIYHKTQSYKRPIYTLLKLKTNFIFILLKQLKNKTNNKNIQYHFVLHFPIQFRQYIIVFCAIFFLKYVRILYHIKDKHCLLYELFYSTDIIWLLKMTTFVITLAGSRWKHISCSRIFTEIHTHVIMQQKFINVCPSVTMKWSWK